MSERGLSKQRGMFHDDASTAGSRRAARRRRPLTLCHCLPTLSPLSLIHTSSLTFPAFCLPSFLLDSFPPPEIRKISRTAISVILPVSVDFHLLSRGVSKLRIEVENGAQAARMV